MRVKKKGNNSGAWKMDVVCPCCEAELEISHEDLTVRSREGFFKKKFWFETRCCECNQTITIDKDDVPNNVKSDMISNMSTTEFLLSFYF